MKVMTLGEKLQKLRKSRGWSQEQLAAEIHVSRQALSKWELGTAVPDTENVLLLARLFDVSTDFLLKDEWEEEQNPVFRQPAVAPPVRRRVFPAAVMGSVLIVLSLAGMLTMGILSSIHPVHVSYATAVAASGEVLEQVDKTGLAAYLSVYHLQWLFDLCIAGTIVGVVIVLLPWWMPVVRRWGRKAWKWLGE